MTNPGTKSALAAALVCASGAGALGADENQEREARLIAVLKSNAGLKEKSDACRELGVYGGEDAVAPLAALLGDEKLSHMARYGLEPNPAPSVDEVLRAALARLEGGPLVGVIGSIGVRRDEKAVDALAKRLNDSDTTVARAAARALGKIGTVEAIKALRGSLDEAPRSTRLALCEGLLRCADAQAAHGHREIAVTIYECVQKSDAPQYIRDAAAAAAKHAGQ